MSAGREFQVEGAATEKARRTSSMCMRGTTSVGASDLYSAFRSAGNTEALDAAQED